MQSPLPLSTIPHFLTAATPQELRRLMFKNNLRTGIIFKYFDIQQMDNGDWIAWYFHDLNINTLVKEDLMEVEENV